MSSKFIQPLNQAEFNFEITRRVAEDTIDSAEGRGLLCE